MTAQGNKGIPDGSECFASSGFVQRTAPSAATWIGFAVFCIWALASSSLNAGNFSAGITPATVPWPGGIVPYEFTNALTTTQQKVYLEGLREFVRDNASRPGYGGRGDS